MSKNVAIQFNLKFGNQVETEVADIESCFASKYNIDTNHPIELVFNNLAEKPNIIIKYKDIDLEHGDTFDKDFKRISPKNGIRTIYCNNQEDINKIGKNTSYSLEYIASCHEQNMDERVRVHKTEPTIKNVIECTPNEPKHKNAYMIEFDVNGDRYSKYFYRDNLLGILHIDPSNETIGSFSDEDSSDIASLMNNKLVEYEKRAEKLQKIAGKIAEIREQRSSPSWKM